MIFRVKELWQRRTAIERVLGATNKDNAVSDRLSGPGEIVWTSYITYKIEWERKAAELRLTGTDGPGNRKGLARAWWSLVYGRAWKKREREFSQWADDRAQEEVNVNVEPVELNDLPNFPISTTDLIHLR